MVRTYVAIVRQGRGRNSSVTNVTLFVYWGAFEMASGANPLQLIFLCDMRSEEQAFHIRECGRVAVQQDSLVQRKAA